MVNEDKVYEAFGELLYAVVKTGGAIQQKELAVITEMLKGYKWGETVLWSFNYEKGHNRSVKEDYDRALDTFTEYGPFRYYEQFFDVLGKVAESSIYMAEKEKKLIDKFRQELLERFIENEDIQYKEEDDEEENKEEEK